MPTGGGGVWTGRGSRSIRRYTSASDYTPGASRPRAPRSLTANRSRRPSKTTERGGPHGYDGAKKLSGRKRHLLVDTLGLVVKALVHPADIQDRASAPRLLLTVADALPRLELIWADSA